MGEQIRVQKQRRRRQVNHDEVPMPQPVNTENIHALVEKALEDIDEVLEHDNLTPKETPDES